VDLKYFCIFNPIELIWSDLKKGIRKHNNHAERSPAVIVIIRQKVKLITPLKWDNCIRHVIKVEGTFNLTPPQNVIIHINDDSSESNIESD
jgi:hypothetical protein